MTSTHDRDPMDVRPHFAHVLSTMKLGGAESRTITIINRWGDKFRHTIVCLDREYEGYDHIEPHVPISDLRTPDQQGDLFVRLRKIRKVLASIRADLILTHGWGTIEWAMAGVTTRTPVLHQEDGFNADEALRQVPRRMWTRRVVLPWTKGVLVCSENLKRLAIETWKLKDEHVLLIPNGVPVELFDTTPAPDAIPGFVRRDDEIVVGTLAGLRPVKNLRRLVRAFAAASKEGPPARLIIIGAGIDEANIRAEADRCGVADRLIMPGFLSDPYKRVGHFDIFCLSSDSEQFPISLVEAMAARKPVICTDVGDICQIVSDSNRPYVVAREDEAAFADKLCQLIQNRALREQLGADNRRKVSEAYSERAMLDAYESAYLAAMKRS